MRYNGWLSEKNLRAYTENLNPPEVEPAEEEKGRCIVCGEEIDKDGVCENCKSDIVYTIEKVAGSSDNDKIEETAGMICDALYEFDMGSKRVSELYEILLEVFEW